MATDPFELINDFAKTQYGLAARDQANAEEYRKAILEAQLGNQKMDRSDQQQQRRMRLQSDLDMQEYEAKQPFEREQRRYASELATDAYGDRLAMRGQLVNPRDVSAEELIAGFEDYRDKPYWDVNHYRVGYGSDTTTDENGNFSRVTPSSRVDRAGAERDLSRRVGETQAAAIKKLGQDTWDVLTPNAKAAVTSVAYNYGEVPDRIVKAAQSGNQDALATAVEGLGSDNNGVNRGRRAKEARLIRQKSSAGPSMANGANSMPLSPEAAEYFTSRGYKPLRQVKMSAGQIELLPPEMKSQFVPNPFGKADRYGNVPYVMVEQGGTKSTNGDVVDDLDLSDLDEQ